MRQYAVDVGGLSFAYNGYKVLEDLSLKIPVNSFVAIVGPNGAGKSTFLQILLGLLKPSLGIITIFGVAPRKVPPHWIGYVPQAKTMDRSFPALSIELVVSGIQYRWPWKISDTNRQKASRALEMVDAAHLAERPLGKLSGGELQRVFLARSLVRHPKLIILDEPTTGIDEVGKKDMYRLLERYLQCEGGTCIMVTHDWHAANHHADLVLLVNQQQIGFGPPQEALREENLQLAFGHIGHQHTLKKNRERNYV